MPGELHLDPKRLALVVIDLQKGIVAPPVQPHSAASVIANASRLAAACRARGAFVVLVHVGPSPDGKDALLHITVPVPPRPPPVSDWDEFIPEVGPKPGDHVVRKRQWGAFYGTDLDLQLRRRGIDTIILCGISTNFGVESTARDAYERGYHQIFVEDACSSRAAEDHAFPFRAIFPRIGVVRTTADVLRALGVVP